MLPDLTADASSSSGTGLDRPIATGASPQPIDPNKKRRKKDGRSLVPIGDTKLYKYAMACVALRAQGWDWKSIAEELQLSEHTVKTYMHRARSQGWLNLGALVQPQDKLDYVIAAKTIENIHQGLGERTDEGNLTAGAREMTLEAAKGIGLFKAHQVVKGDVGPQVGVALSVHVQLPPNAEQLSTIKIRPGTLGGMSSVDVPADAEIIDSDEA